jgi:D-glycero-beta-D-manno-heptose-7-phosphate kinase
VIPRLQTWSHARWAGIERGISIVRDVGANHTVSYTRIEQLMRGFARQRVVVVGDMVADQYIHGTPQRISREAPVIVLEFSHRQLVPGGATNVAVNLRALGAHVDVIGVIGDDAEGLELRGALDSAGIGTSGLITDPGRPTSTKTRIVGGGTQVVPQQIVRIDRMSSSHVSGAVRDSLLAEARRALRIATGLILSDYEHGVIDPEVAGLCLQHRETSEMVTTVDAHGDLFRFSDMTLATPNQPEAEATLGRPLNGADDPRAGCAELLHGLRAQGVLITRGSHGMVALDSQGTYTELPASIFAEVRDVTGAGDTVAAVATLTLCAGGTLHEAAVIGNAAAGQVVRHFGAATVSTPVLLAALRPSAD